MSERTEFLDYLSRVTGVPLAKIIEAVANWELGEYTTTDTVVRAKPPTGEMAQRMLERTSDDWELNGLRRSRMSGAEARRRTEAMRAPLSGREAQQRIIQMYRPRRKEN
jgi:hypothetical protein